MAFFHTNDPERELLFDCFTRRGYSGTALSDKINEAKAMIEEGKPLAYITNEAYFFDSLFYVDERVLIPRPDTERLCEKAIPLLKKGSVFADLGTGSGAIALTVLKHCPDSRAVALDLSEKALAVAEKNAASLGLSERVEFIRGDMKEITFPNESFDLILSNPPYIPTDDIARYPSLSYEPILALDGGRDGMDFYRALLIRHRAALKKGGGFLFEIGFDQSEAIRTLAAGLGYTCEVYKDYGKNDRVALLFPIV